MNLSVCNWFGQIRWAIDFNILIVDYEIGYVCIEVLSLRQFMNSVLYTLLTCINKYMYAKGKVRIKFYPHIVICLSFHIQYNPNPNLMSYRIFHKSGLFAHLCYML